MPSSFAMDVTAQDVVDGEADTELRAVVELEKLGRLFDEADTDGSGTIDKSEFIRWVPELAKSFVQKNSNEALAADDPEELFDLLDEDQSGELDFNELRDWLISLAEGHDASVRGIRGRRGSFETRISKAAAWPSKEGWIEVRTPGIFFSSTTRGWAVLNGNDELLRFYEDSKAHGSEDGEILPPVSLHDSQQKMVARGEATLRLEYKNGTVYELIFSNSEEKNDWWVTLRQTQNLTRRLVTTPSVPLKLSAFQKFCEPDVNAPQQRVVSAGAVVGTSTVPGFNVMDDGSIQPHYWHVAKVTYEKVLNLIIRPKRAEYPLSKLGPRLFDFGGVKIARVDFTVTNERGMKVQCSQWHSATAGSPQPTIIYLHGNASCRVEAVKSLSLCLSMGISLVTLDCSGSGKSDGAYVSLGHFEKQDVAALAVHLRDSGKASKIGLWGRSMGAVTSLMTTALDPLVAAVVADSPFASLDLMARDLVHKAIKSKGTFQDFITGQAISMVDSSMEYRAGFKMADSDPFSIMAACRAPVMLVHGEQDTFIGIKHSEKLFEQCQSEKQFERVPGGSHNGIRPVPLTDKIASFFSKHLLGQDSLPQKYMEFRTKMMPFYNNAMVRDVCRMQRFPPLPKGVGQQEMLTYKAQQKVVSNGTQELCMNPLTAAPWFADWAASKKLSVKFSGSRRAQLNAALSVAEKLLEDQVTDEFNSGMTDERAEDVQRNVGAAFGR